MKRRATATITRHANSLVTSTKTGCWCQAVACPLEDGAAFMKAMDAMVSALNPPIAGSEELEESEEEVPEKTFLQKRADALLALAEQAMSTMDEGLRPLASAEKYQVAVHIERERVAEGVLRTDHHQCSVERHRSFPTVLRHCQASVLRCLDSHCSGRLTRRRPECGAQDSHDPSLHPPRAASARWWWLFRNLIALTRQ